MSNPIKRWSDSYIALFEQRILLLILTLFSASIIISDQATIYQLEKQLREKEYILAPGTTNFSKVTPGIISKDYVKDFAENFSRSLGSFSAREVEARYAELEKYLATDFRIKFREKTKKDLSLLSTNDVSEIFEARTVEVKETEDGFIASIFGAQSRFVSGLRVFEGGHVITITLKGIVPQANTPWALEVQDISRQSEEEFLKQKRNL